MSISCSACAGGPVVQDPFYYRWLDRDWWLMRCKACSHQFIYPFVTEEEQAIIYSDQYFSKEGDWVVGVWDADYQAAEPNLRDEARDILRMIGSKRGRLLDIGCAGGFFMDEARKAGFEVDGIEFNPSMVKHAREKLGLDVIQGGVEKIPADAFADEARKFDVVVLLDVLEHVPRPGEMLAKVHKWMKPGATLMIRGPLSNSPLARAKESVRRLLGRKKQLPGYPLDANTFGKRSMRAMAKQNGFREERWEGTTPDFGNFFATRIQGEEFPVR